MNTGKIKQIVSDAFELEPFERDAFVRQACGDDPALLGEVQSLLLAASSASEAGFLRGGGMEVDQTITAPIGERPGDHIGPYKLLEQIGEGGFGVVFMAEQEKPVRRAVAVKVIKVGMDTREVVARFEAERQALAMMDHPNIARVLDAGSTGAGRPYFVMELVRGSPITEYCDKNKMSTEDRVALSATVCRAVQHAHGKGIIHRDIKPSNVLVTTSDGKPVPKVIDFGIAKATQARLTDKTLFTAFRQMIGTPQYMSPEQADSDGSDVDTRTDVYGLGVLIYELLVGTTPFDAKSLRMAAIEEMRRIIRDVEPPRPSTRLNTMIGDTLSTVASLRGIEPKRLGQIVRGELDWIVMKALEKDRARRYDTAAALADDLNRYLAGEAVLAGRPGGLYRLRKIARRYKAALGVAAVVGLALVLGVTGTTIGLVRESRQRAIAEQATALARAEKADADKDRAEAQQQRSKAEARFADVRQLANDFMFKFDDALINVAGATPARKMLAETALRYLDRLNRDAASDKSLSYDLATSYVKVGDILGNPGIPNVGDTNQALASYGKSIAILTSLVRDDPGNRLFQRAMIRVLTDVGDVQAVKGQTDEAIATLHNALEMNLKFTSEDPANTLARANLARIHQRIGGIQAAKGQVSEAMKSYRASVEIPQSLLLNDPGNEELLNDLMVGYERVGEVQFQTGLDDDALANYSKSQEINEKLVHNHPDNVALQRNLLIGYGKIGDIQMMKGLLDDSLVSCNKSMAIRLKLAKADPANVIAQHDLAAGYDRMGEVRGAQGRVEDASDNYAKALDIYQSLARADPGSATAQRHVATCQFRLASMQEAAGKTNDALANDASGLEIMHALVRADPRNASLYGDLSDGCANTGAVLLAHGKVDEALANFREGQQIVLGFYRASPGNAQSKSHVVEDDANVSRCQLLLKDFDGALSSVQDGLKIDPASLLLDLNLAHALLLTHQQDQARAIYLKHMGEKIPERNKLWQEVVADDFADFQKQGVTTPGMADVLEAMKSAGK